MTDLSKLKVKIFSDGADLDDMLEQLKNPLITGFNIKNKKDLLALKGLKIKVKHIMIYEIY